MPRRSRSPLRGKSSWGTRELCSRIRFMRNTQVFCRAVACPKPISPLSEQASAPEISIPSEGKITPAGARILFANRIPKE